MEKVLSTIKHVNSEDISLNSSPQLSRQSEVDSYEIMTLLEKITNMLKIFKLNPNNYL